MGISIRSSPSSLLLCITSGLLIFYLLSRQIPVHPVTAPYKKYLQLASVSILYFLAPPKPPEPLAPLKMLQPPEPLTSRPAASARRLRLTAQEWQHMTAAIPFSYVFSFPHPL